MLRITEITKAFGATRALRGAQLELLPGEVHALVGENGAGKSTLFKICAGLISPDDGEMRLNDQLYRPRDLFEAQRLRVALVLQDITISPALGIAENIFIDRLRQFAGLLGFSRWCRLRQAAATILTELGADFSVESKVSSLSLGQLKTVEIARAISHDPRVLLFDETTAFLDTREIQSLFKVILLLKARGLAIGYISHHLEELNQVADRITILKDGEWMGCYGVNELDRREIETKMVGRAIGSSIFPPKVPVQTSATPVLELDAIDAPNLNTVDLDVRSGEIVGLGGLRGSGADQVLIAIMGEIRLRAGTMRFLGNLHRPRAAHEAWRSGIAYVPGDRTGEALLMDLSVALNLSLAALAKLGGRISRAFEQSLILRLIGQLKIRPPVPRLTCRVLSGGNLQKVALGKCLAVKPVLLLLDNPTRGIDIGARAQIYQVLRDQVKSGMTILLATEDLSELLGLSDRIVIFRKGRLSRIFDDASVCSEEEVVAHMI